MPGLLGEEDEVLLAARLDDCDEVVDELELTAGVAGGDLLQILRPALTP